MASLDSRLAALEHQQGAIGVRQILVVAFGKNEAEDLVGFALNGHNIDRLPGESLEALHERLDAMCPADGISVAFARYRGQQ